MTREQALRVWLHAFAFALGEPIDVEAHIVEDRERRELFEDWWAEEQARIRRIKR